MKRLLSICVFVALVAIAASAQERFMRRACIQGVTEVGAKTRALPTPNQNWDPSRTYRQAVILVQYADMAFSMDDPKTYYDQLLNLTTSNTRGGAGCAADYFRDQSGGRLNIQFDVYGPVLVSQKAQSTSGSDNYGDAAWTEATKKALDSLHVDFSPYDWNQDGEVDQVVYIAAGYCANVGGSKFSKYIWPSTGWLSRIKVAEGLYVHQYSASAEKWYNEIPCGIGTVCHEFSHCLGLPDLYPTYGSNTPFSVVDEWDLMDGGNFTAWGWCPPNYSALERHLLGWLSIDEITANGVVSDMKPVADGGKAYKITKEGDDYYLLENRQQKGWDRGLPGKGLLIAHVNYSQSVWKSNTVNGTKFRYELLHADGLDYDAWEAHIQANNQTEYLDTENNMNRRYLSTSAYPMITDTLEVHQCADMPLQLMNIQLSDAGTISFDVLATGIKAVGSEADDDSWYDLQGRRLSAKPTRRGIYIHHKKKVAF